MDYYANTSDQFPAAGSRHPTADCAEFMRNVLLDDAEEIRDGAPFVASRWSKAAKDAGVTAPPRSDEMGVGRFLDDMKRQVRNASRTQVAGYYRKLHSECPVCGAHWSMGRR